MLAYMYDGILLYPRVSYCRKKKRHIHSTKEFAVPGRRILHIRRLRSMAKERGIRLEPVDIL